MANDYFLLRASDYIQCSKENYEKLKTALLDYPTFEVFYQDGMMYLYSDGDCDFDVLEDEGDKDTVVDILKDIVREAGVKFLSFCYAHYCDKPRPGSCGGGEFRIYPDCGIIYPDERYS